MNQSRLLDDKSMDNMSMLNSFDLGALEEMDPSLNGGYRVVYDKEIPIELRLVEDEKDANETGTLESIKTKILIQGDIEAPECIKVELTSEADLFFHYTCMVSPESFAELRELQQLNVGFDAFIGLLIRMFNNVHKEPHVFFSI